MMRATSYSQPIYNIMKTRPILLTAVTFLISASFALAATKLSINTAGELNIADTNGKEVKTLTQGSVGDIVRADNQSFKISYGKDLQGNATIILYADPANPASVKINFQDKNINLSKDAVLTIVIDSAGSILQSGVLGQVMVENEKMAPSSNMRISNSGTLMASATPIVPVQEQPSVQIPVTSTPANRLSAPSVASGPAVVSYVTGKVYISQNGGPEVPMTDMSEIKPGTIIRTGDDGNVSFHPFPDVSTTVIKNSIFTIRELAYNPTGEAGKPDRRLLGFLSTGKLINVLDTKDNGITNYQIQTPIQIFTAVGTRFVVSVDPDVNQSLV